MVALREFPFVAAAMSVLLAQSIAVEAAAENTMLQQQRLGETGGLRGHAHKRRNDSSRLASANCPSTYVYLISFQATTPPVLYSFWGVGDVPTQTGTDQGASGGDFQPYVAACNPNGCVVGGQVDTIGSNKGGLGTYSATGENPSLASFENQITAVTPPLQSGMFYVATAAPQIEVCQFNDPGNCLSELAVSFSSTINVLALDGSTNQLWVGLDNGVLQNCGIALGGQLSCSQFNQFTNSITSIAISSAGLAVTLFDDTNVYLYGDAQWSTQSTPAVSSSNPDGPYMSVAADTQALYVMDPSGNLYVMNAIQQTWFYLGQHLVTPLPKSYPGKFSNQIGGDGINVFVQNLQYSNGNYLGPLTLPSAPFNFNAQNSEIAGLGNYNSFVLPY